MCLNDKIMFFHNAGKIPDFHLTTVAPEVNDVNNWLVIDKEHKEVFNWYKRVPSIRSIWQSVRYAMAEEAEGTLDTRARKWVA